MAASIVRSAAASTLRRRPSIPPRALPGGPYPLALLQQGLHGIAATSLTLPPATITNADRHLSSTNQGMSEMEQERVEKRKAELLRQMVLEDATADKAALARERRYRTKDLEDFLRRQIQLDPAGGPAAAAGHDIDKHLLLALLVRSTRAEETLSSDARTVEQLAEKVKQIKIFVIVLRKLVYTAGLPVLAALIVPIPQWFSSFAQFSPGISSTPQAQP